MLLDEMREELTGEKSYGVQVNKVQHDTGTGSYPGHIYICCTMLEKKIFLSKQKKKRSSSRSKKEARKRREKWEDKAKKHGLCCSWACRPFKFTDTEVSGYVFPGTFQYPVLDNIKCRLYLFVSCSVNRIEQTCPGKVQRSANCTPPRPDPFFTIHATDSHTTLYIYIFLFPFQRV